MRQIILDTETTGLEPAQGHRIIEIGCVELINRRPSKNHFHHYLQPDRPIDPGAKEVHGISDEFLADKPRFKDIAAEFLDFIKGAELIIHNAAFDVAFLNNELRLLDPPRGEVTQYCKVLCTLTLARKMHPGQKNTLDALCKRYTVDNSQRTRHGALLDAEILADVYLAMTGGQASLSLDATQDASGLLPQQTIRRLPANRPRLLVPQAQPEELAAHENYLQAINKASGGRCLWNKQE
ncbi:MAG: DNA polymerase III subunit epsilon [Pseudomonadota bacterium]